MTERRKAQIAQRKQPKQSRSNELVSIILEAAAQVLAKEGAARFTTAWVAEKAGVSVGSLYQYFPNKASILLALERRVAADDQAVTRDPRLSSVGKRFSETPRSPSEIEAYADAMSYMF
jgi:AcrR family transcriptional regulator